MHIKLNLYMIHICIHICMYAYIIHMYTYAHFISRTNLALSQPFKPHQQIHPICVQSDCIFPHLSVYTYLSLSFLHLSASSFLCRIYISNIVAFEQLWFKHHLLLTISVCIWLAPPAVLPVNQRPLISTIDI